MKKPAENIEQQSEFERYEAKYVIHPSLVPLIREFIEPFCRPDPHAGCVPPEYVVTTLQLDTPLMALHYAREREELSRFKLRVRTYGLKADGPVFLEIKRKIKGVVLKSRAMIPHDHWGPETCRRVDTGIPFVSHHEALNYGEFLRLVDKTGAGPVMLIRYLRESYLSRDGTYARVTFDRRLQYAPTRSWEVPPRSDVRWKAMDSGMALNRPYSGVILELKTYRDAPLWMVELTERFDLVRVGFCKYSTAVRLESLYLGAAYSEQSENCSEALILL